MTVAESIIGGIALAIFTGILGLLLGGKKKVTEDRFLDHVNSSFPHMACPIHETQLKAIEKKLDRIDTKIDNLLER